MSRFIPGRKAGGFAKPHKFGATRTTLVSPIGAEIVFMSRAEAAYVSTLWRREAAGEITRLRLQPKWVLHAGTALGPVTIKLTRGVLTYAADAEYWDADGYHVDDVKGMDDDKSIIKRAHLLAEYGISVRIVRLRPAAVNRALALYAAMGVRPVRGVAA